MKTALITGVTGQDGSYLAELLLAKDYRVVGVRRRSATPNTSNLGSALSCGLELVEGDLADAHSLASIVERAQPDEVYNLAAQSHVATSFEQPAYTCQTNYCGVLSLLEAVRKYVPKARVYQASTSEMFGSNYSADGFQDEQTPFAPNSPYAVAKLAANHACRIYRESYSLHISCGILFNHESERRGEAFVTRKITKFVGLLARLARACRSPVGEMGFERLKLGNLYAKRDWGHAEDYVRGMWLMLQQEKPDDYVLATGETHSVCEFVEAAIAAAGFQGKAEDFVKTDPAFLRPCEVPYLRGCADKAHRVLGWKPEISFEQLVRRMVEHDIADATRCQ